MYFTVNKYQGIAIFYLYQIETQTYGKNFKTIILANN